MNCVYVDLKPNQQRILSNIAQGLGLQAQPLSQFVAKSSVGPIFFMGIAYGAGHLYKWCLKNNRDFYYIDHAYVLAGYNLSFEWMRITRNEFLYNKTCTSSAERHNRYFGHIRCKKFRGLKGKYILASAPSDGVEYVFPGSRSWFKHNLDILSKDLGLPVRIRPKRIQVRMDPYGQIREIRKNEVRPLAMDLADAACIFTYNSNLAVDAAIEGIPVYVNQRNAAWPISQQLGSIVEPDTDSWLASLLTHQFNSEEMLAGQILPILQSQ